MKLRERHSNLFRSLERKKLRILTKQQFSVLENRPLCRLAGAAEACQEIGYPLHRGNSHSMLATSTTATVPWANPKRKRNCLRQEASPFQPWGETRINLSLTARVFSGAAAGPLTSNLSPPSSLERILLKSQAPHSSLDRLQNLSLITLALRNFRSLGWIRDRLATEMRLLGTRAPSLVVPLFRLAKSALTAFSCCPKEWALSTVSHAGLANWLRTVILTRLVAHRAAAAGMLK